jgi:hypothetical protein
MAAAKCLLAVTYHLGYIAPKRYIRNIRDVKPVSNASPGRPALRQANRAYRVIRIRTNIPLLFPVIVHGRQGGNAGIPYEHWLWRGLRVVAIFEAPVPCPDTREFAAGGK